MGVEGITPVWQVEAPKYPRNKFCCLARGGTESSLQEPRCAVLGCPGEDPPPHPKTAGSPGVLHRWACLGKEVTVPRKKNKILDSSNHLLSPDSSSTSIPLPLAGCSSSTRLPGGSRPAGGGAGAGGGARGRGRGVHAGRPGRLPRSGEGAVTTRRLPARPPPHPTPQKMVSPTPTRDAEAGGKAGNHSRNPWLSLRRQKELIPEGAMSFGAEMWFPKTEPEPRERLGGAALTTGCVWASSLPVPLSLRLPRHPLP